ncbi:MAG: alpha/beta fold dioxygenase AqdC [Ktedonobacteraceae bacterium]
METRAENVRIVYDDMGQGEPALLFTPGWCASRTMYRELMSLCSVHRRTLTLDWAGHGDSDLPAWDFGASSLIEEAVAVIEASHVQHIVPVTNAHSGWIAIELRRRLGERIPKIVFLDWIIAEAPAAFLNILQGIQDPEHWQQAREQLFSTWLASVDNQKVKHFVRDIMGSYGYDMWKRSGREIAHAYAQAGSPLQELATLQPPVTSLHLYTQPDDPTYLAIQQGFAEKHPWFNVQKIAAPSHFPMIEVPQQVAQAIERFVA